MCILTEAKDVRMIELEFSTGTFPGGDPVTINQRLIQGCGRPVAGITTLRRYLSLKHADARGTGKKITLRAGENREKSEREDGHQRVAIHAHLTGKSAATQGVLKKWGCSCLATRA